jgi:hypothetical protein
MAWTAIAGEARTQIILSGGHARLVASKEEMYQNSGIKGF